jgi:hypothetical protein
MLRDRTQGSAGWHQPEFASRDIQCKQRPLGAALSGCCAPIAIAPTAQVGSDRVKTLTITG